MRLVVERVNLTWRVNAYGNDGRFMRSMRHFHYRHRAEEFAEKLRRQLDDAIATEARRAETLQDGSVHEGAGLAEASPKSGPEGTGQ